MSKSKIVVASITFTLLSVVLMSKPLLMIFNQPPESGSVPALFIYVLIVWLITAAGSYLIFGRKSDTKLR